MSLAFVEINGPPRAPTKGFWSHTLYDPGKEPEWGALATHHITLESIKEKKCPPWRGEAPVKIDDEDITYYVGHGVDFDWGAVGKPEVKRICTLALSRWLFPEMDSHKLVAMYYRLHGVSDSSVNTAKQAHDALADATMTVTVFFEILKRLAVADPQQYGLTGTTFGIHYEETGWDRIWEWSEHARIPTVFAFGKNRGKLIRTIDKEDPGYRSWMLKQKDIDPYLRIALETQR